MTFLSEAKKGQKVKIGGPEKKSASEVLVVEVIRNHRRNFKKWKKFVIWPFNQSMQHYISRQEFKDVRIYKVM